MWRGRRGVMSQSCLWGVWVKVTQSCLLENEFEDCVQVLLAFHCLVWRIRFQKHSGCTPIDSQSIKSFTPPQNSHTIFQKLFFPSSLELMFHISYLIMFQLLTMRCLFNYLHDFNYLVCITMIIHAV